MITIAEEFLLLALDEKEGKVLDIPQSRLPSLLIGAALMELSLMGRVDTDARNLFVITTEPTGSRVLDHLLNVLKSSGNRELLGSWLIANAAHGKRLRDLAFEGLISRGILKKTDEKILWVFPDRRYPIIAGKEVIEVETRLRSVILSDYIPEPRDAVLISLVQAAGLFAQIFSPREFKRVSERIKMLARLEIVGQKVAGSIQRIESAVSSLEVPF